MNTLIVKIESGVIAEVYSTAPAQIIVVIRVKDLVVQCSRSDRRPSAVKVAEKAA